MRVIDGQSNVVARLSHLLSPLHLSAVSSLQTKHNKYNITPLVLFEILIPHGFWFLTSASVGQYLTNLCSLFWIKFQNVIPARTVSLTCSVFSSSNPDTKEEACVRGLGNLSKITPTIFLSRTMCPKFEENSNHFPIRRSSCLVREDV